VLEKLGNLISKYCLPTMIDDNKNFSENFEIVERIIRNGDYHISAKLDVLKLEKQSEIQELFFESDQGKMRIREFLDNGYRLDGDCIVCDSYIPVEIVSYDRNKVKLVDSDKFKEYGFGIQEFRIYLDLRIFDVYCKGLHPNVNPNTNKFCIDNSITILEITYDNIENFVKPILGCINLSFAYLDMENTRKIKELLNGCRAPQ